MIKKAIIPAAGLGTRLSPITNIIPKEILPIFGRPMIQWCIEEVIVSGIKEICIILSQGKELVKDYVSSELLIDYPTITNKALLQKLVKNCYIHYVYQKKPLGIADAVSAAKDFVGKDSFAIYLPDIIFIANEPGLIQIQRKMGEDISNVFGLYRVPKSHGFEKTGLCKFKKLSKGKYKLLDLKKKEIGFLRGGEIIIFPPLILDSYYFEVLDEIMKDANKLSEIDDGPIFQKIIATKGIRGILLSGEGFDVGNKRGFGIVNEYFSKFDTRLSRFKNYLSELTMNYQ